METDDAPLDSSTVRSALADVERVRASAVALSATPWPTWFLLILTVYIAVLPITFGGVLAGRDWLLPRSGWLVIMIGVIVVYLALPAVAARSWRAKTGVALRLDVLPKRATVPYTAGLPVLLLGAPVVFRYTDRPEWLFAASLTGAAVSVGFHLAFVRLHWRAA
ncbi:hypothetical protein ROS62_24180 [Streptomyces sp. DSM 41972]|uniref:Uncharacterized protein n=1 Tax=Streptomyces althioticus subsp. attaecolombicae TaxID=3075534 RepID=A0ABU3I4B9_9ACTN|nr:hypothetical protein [Streptomyces sp. DSM 41972]SCD63085.1 hypothetical protein GA0115238_11869 [Streptomyces sp. di50b]SCD65374.1 hypothetical protein GA0115245_11099 [Streptomyces sp. di188]